MIQVFYENSHAALQGAPADLVDLLAYDLSYKAEDPTDVSDGYRRLLSQNGYLPSGLVPRLLRLLTKYGQRYEVIDQRTPADCDIPLGYDLGLRDYQTDAVQKACVATRGVIAAPPRSGKTRIGAGLIERLAVPTIWITPTRALVAQAVRYLTALLPGVTIRTQTGTPKGAEYQRLSQAYVVVTTAATAVKLSRGFYGTRGMLIVDEFHHAAAKTYREISTLADRVYYRFGLTGTHFRSDPETEILMESVLSNRIVDIPVQFLIDEGHLVPGRFYFVPIDGPRVSVFEPTEVYRHGLVHNDLRNQWIAYYASALAAAGRKVLVLVKWVEHGKRLEELIPGSKFVSGEDNREGDGVIEAIEAFNAGHIPVFIGTSVLGEGVDLPAADALVYAKAGRASVTVTQDYFRVLTRSDPKKKDALIVDFVDRCHGQLMNQSVARGLLYAKEEAFQVEVVRDTGDLLRRLSG